MSWDSAASDLRTLLSDNSKDKHCYRKSVFGELNGTNRRFKTLEFRRINNFTNGTAPVPPAVDPTYTAPPLGVWKNGVILTNTDISSDNPETGDFELASAPAEGDTVEASYYAQWFNDEEIQQFLRIACNWLALGDDFNQIPPGLRPAALKYASAEAYQKLASRWSQMLSEQYLRQDATEKNRFAIVDAWMKAADTNRKEAYKTRDDYYSRSGQSNIPYASSIQGTVPNPVPNR